MSDKTRRQSDLSVTAVLHRAGGSLRGLIARTGEDRPVLLDAREMDAADATLIQGWLDEHQVGRVIGVVPAGSVVCRTCSLPDADLGELMAALQLQADAQLPDVAPPHRMALAVLPAAPGETSRTGVMEAWPESAPCDLPEISQPTLYAPDVAGLAALLNGQRPADPLVWQDPIDGSVAVAISHATGAVLRSTREEPSADEGWSRAVSRVIAETAIRVGHTGSFVESVAQSTRQNITALRPAQAALLAPQEVIEAATARLEGAVPDRAWWATYGVAAGVLLASLDELAPLTQLQAALPTETPSLARSITQSLSKPQTALRAVAAVVLILAFSPLLLSGGRLLIMKMRSPDLKARLAAVKQANDQLVMYTELESQAWSMTKILSDIACNTPEGIELDFVGLSHDDKRMTVRGSATPHNGRTATEVVIQMQENLYASNIFDAIVPSWGKGNKFADNYEFDLSGKVVNPHWRHEYPQELDYGRWTLADRRQGKRPGAADEDADTPTDAAGASEEPETPAVTDAEDVTAEVPSPPGRSEVRRPLGDGPPVVPGGGRRRSANRDTGTGVPVSMDVPEPLEPGQIEAMTPAEVREAVTRWATARNYARTRGDEALRERLKVEFKLLFERLREGE